MKKFVSLLLAALLLCSLFALSSCKKESTPDTTLEINVWTLNGTTGFGMAQLMDAKAKQSVYALKRDSAAVRAFDEAFSVYLKEKDPQLYHSIFLDDKKR